MTAMRRIGLLGGEATGKSTLAADLASTLPACLVPEALRSFVETHGRPPEQHEQAALMDRQWQDEEDVARTCALGVVVADPAPLMTAVYSELYFSDPSLIPRGADLARGYDLVVWCAPDLPWQAEDGQRDGPEHRDAADAIIARIVSTELATRGIRVIRVTGDRDARVAAVRQAWQP